MMTSIMCMQWHMQFIRIWNLDSICLSSTLHIFVCFFYIGTPLNASLFLFQHLSLVLVIIWSVVIIDIPKWPSGLHSLLLMNMNSNIERDMLFCFFFGHGFGLKTPHTHRAINEAIKFNSVSWSDLNNFLTCQVREYSGGATWFEGT